MEEKKQLTNMPFNRGGLADYHNIALIAAYIHCLQIPFYTIKSFPELLWIPFCDLSLFMISYLGKDSEYSLVKWFYKWGNDKNVPGNQNSEEEKTKFGKRLFFEGYAEILS